MIDRRKLFALGGLGAIGATTGQSGPELDPSSAAVTVRLSRRLGVWSVLVPDWEYAGDVGAMAIPLKWMPLTEFLATLDGSLQA